MKQFGSDLTALLHQQSHQYLTAITPPLSIPLPLLVLHSHIVSHITSPSPSLEGLFRVSPSVVGVMRMRDLIDGGDYSVDTDDVHLVAGLFKRFLRELAVPVVPFVFYEECCACQSGEEAVKVYEKFPEAHKDLLVWLAGLLKEVINPIYLRYTKMDLSNLIIVFTPTLMPAPPSQVAAMRNADEIRFMRFLMTSLMSPPYSERPIVTKLPPGFPKIETAPLLQRSTTTTHLIDSTEKEQRRSILSNFFHHRTSKKVDPKPDTPKPQPIVVEVSPVTQEIAPKEARKSMLGKFLTTRHANRGRSPSALREEFVKNRQQSVEMLGSFLQNRPSLQQLQTQQTNPFNVPVSNLQKIQE